MARHPGIRLKARPVPSFTTRFGRGLLNMSVGLPGKKQCRRAGRSRWGLGPVLAAMALLLQIISVPTLHWPGLLRLANDSGDLSAALDEHALCLSGDRNTSDNPTDQAPKPVHHNSALCCFWHGYTALAQAPAAALEPVAFARSGVIFAPWKQVSPRRLTGAMGARAPPIQA